MPDSLALVLNKFKGLNTSTTYAELDDGEFPIFANVRLFNGGRKIIQRRGQAPVSAMIVPSGNLQGLIWTQFGDTESLVAIASGSVYDGLAGTLLAGGVNRFPGGADVNGAWIDFKLVVGDGLHPNCVVTVSGGVLTVSQLTVDPCDASGITLTAGSVTPRSGTYSYAVKFVSALGIEGDVIAYSPSITVTNQVIGLTNIPVCPAGQDCHARKIYRTKDGGSAYFLLTTINNNTTTSFNDNSADGNLGAQMLNQSYQNSPLPPCRYFLSHQNRLYAAGCFQTTGAVTGAVNTLYVSDVLDPTTARIATDPTTTYQGGRFPLEGPAAGTITGLGAYGSMVVPFTASSMHLFTGNQPSLFNLSGFSAHGCAAHRSILMSQEALFWLAPDGLYAWKAQGYLEYTLTQRSYLRVSDAVRDRIDAMAASGMSQASTVFSDNRVWLSWPNGTLVYDLLYDAWYEDTNSLYRLLTASTFTSANRQKVYGARYGLPQVWQLDTGLTDNGSAIPVHLQTKDLDAGLPGHNKRAAWVGGLFRATTETLTGSLIRNAGETIQTWVIPLVSGSAVQVVPTNNNVSRMRQRVPKTADSEFFRLDFQCNATTGQFELLSAQIEFTDQGGGSIDAGGTNG